ncbi:MAG: YbaK/EbsC family protein [Acidimicrobiales bacterium]
MGILERASVVRVRAALHDAGVEGDVVVLDESTRTAADAAGALGVAVGQIASSLVFALPNGDPLLVITSGRHRVDAVRVALALGVAALERADAQYVKRCSGFSIGGVSPLGWCPPGAGAATPAAVIDLALADYGVVWAAAGHSHAVFATTFEVLRRVADATPVRVGDD